jgi:lactate dehydrogenase-like 2-hydroxyacid dehydrogenase
MKILITRRIHPEAVDLLAGRFEVDYSGRNEALPRQFLLDHINKYQGIVSCLTEKFDAELLKRARSNLKIISNMAAGLDNIDIKAAQALGIEIRNTADPVTECTADFTLALALSLVRKVPEAQAYVRQNQWTAWDPEIFLGRTLRDVIWGIVGFGKIGRAVASRLFGFGCRIQYFDPNVTLDDLPPHFRTVLPLSWENLLKTSDIISLHIPFTDATKHLFDRKAFEAMKPTALFVNMARGPVVHTPDLVAALKNHEIAGAALDVIDPEPVRGDHDIFQCDRVIIVPHIGTATEECRREMAMTAAKHILDFFDEKIKP